MILRISRCMTTRCLLPAHYLEVTLICTNSPVSLSLSAQANACGHSSSPHTKVLASRRGLKSTCTPGLFPPAFALACYMQSLTGTLTLTSFTEKLITPPFPLWDRPSAMGSGSYPMPIPSPGRGCCAGLPGPCIALLTNWSRVET